MNDDVTFRPSAGQRWLRGAGFMLFPATLLGFLVPALADTPVKPITASSAIISVVILGLFSGIPSFIAWRAMRVSVTITRAEVVVRNVTGTRHVPLDDLAGFEVGDLSPYSGPATRVRLLPGPHRIPRSFWVAAVTAGGGNRWSSSRYQLEAQRAKIEPIVAEMNAELDRRRGSPSTAERLKTVEPVLRSIPWDDD